MSVNLHFYNEFVEKLECLGKYQILGVKKHLLTQTQFVQLSLIEIQIEIDGNNDKFFAIISLFPYKSYLLKSRLTVR